MAKISCWAKFRLLVWKNWQLQWNKKAQFIFEILLPAVFTMTLIVLRYLVDPKLEDQKIYPAEPISSLFGLFNSIATKLTTVDYHLLSLSNQLKPISFPRRTIPYSPKNDYLEKIMETAAFILKLNTTSYPNAKKLENELEINNYIAGVEFDDSLIGIESFPKKLSFALRFPGQLRTAVTGWSDSWETYHLYPLLAGNYPRHYNDADGGSPLGYLREGFLPIQNAISAAFIMLSSGKTDLPTIKLRRFPYPPFIYDPLLIGLRGTIPLILVLSFIYPCSCLVRSIAHEKEKQLKEVMKIMGLQNAIHWMAWFFRGLGTFSLASILVVFLMQIKWKSDVAVLTYSNWSAVLAFLIVYSITGICLCFMIAVFFSKASTATAVVGLVWFMAHMPYMLMLDSLQSLSWREKMGWCLICNTAMAFGVDIIIGFEGTGEGLQWSNMFSPVNVDDELTLGGIMLMMIISSFIYMAICLYVEQVLPGEFGIRQKWYFPFTRTFWFGDKRYDPKKDFTISKKSRRNTEAFESEPSHKFTGVQIINLSKRFGDIWAVKSLSLNMFENEITVLLGHNGAGKTTTISMLTGLLPPTLGTAIISGYDIRMDLDGARSSLGICPQYNVLFDDLSVSNNIRFFCRLRGIERKAIYREIYKYLKLLEMESKANTPASRLSGGMQRKLSVCCALCGGTKVVLCDEPSSGMDPFARRKLWNLLQAEKTGRTVLLTTHFMDEADVLGDRIAIMYAGELKCYGTAFFLKKKFGSGYRLICIKSDNCDTEKVTALLQQYIPDIQPSGDLGTELSYYLPYKYSNIFEEMLGVLETNSEQLGLNGYGISITSMEEVFMRVGNEAKSSLLSERNISIRFEDDIDSLHSNASFVSSTSRPRKLQIICNQIRAMFLKKVLYAWRKKMIYLAQNIIPIYFVIISIFFTRGTISDNLPPLKIHLTMFDSAFTVLDVSPAATNDPMLNKIAKEYEIIAKSYGPKYKFQSTMGEPFETFLLRLGKTHQVRINKHYMAAASVDKPYITAWFNNQPLHTAPLAVNLVYNAIARAYISPEASITVINKPLKRSTTDRINRVQSGESLGGQLALNACFCMCFLSALYIIFLVKENSSKAKLLQFVAGVRVWIFWMTHLIFDMITFIISVLVLIATLVCFQEKYYSEFFDLFKLLILFFVFGLAALPLTYVLSYCYTEPATAFARVSTINIFLGMALYICVMIMSIPLFRIKHIADKLIWFFMFHPHFSLAFGINELYINSVIGDICNSVKTKFSSKNDTCQAIPQCCNILPPFGVERPGILRELIYMGLVGGFCILILLLRDYRLITNCLEKMKKRVQKQPMSRQKMNIDSDVSEEQKRIASMNKWQIAAQHLVLDRVTKFYGDFLAVNKISLCVKRNECFGLLGVNGAGKTTTFKMLTGDIKVTEGKVFVKGNSVTRDMRKIYKEIGYCPQFDAILEDLTGREILRIFCLIKGIPNGNIRYLSDELAYSFGFVKHIDKPVRKYSGGNKRKLSTALAIVGNPSVIYLDEPSTGMDPAARRRLWDIVCLLRDSGKAIVLSSHSMEECEALCTRLAIMVNGELMCIGSVQHLKNKFSKGFILKIKVHSTTELLKKEKKRSSISTVSPGNDSENGIAIVNSLLDEITNALPLTEDTKSKERETNRETDLEDEIEKEFRKFSNASIQSNTSLVRQAYARKLKSYIEYEFPSARLQDYYQGMLTFSIPLTDIKWSEIFGFMERNLKKLNIEDYAITQTTLEEIFLDFARDQIDVRVHRRNNCCGSSQ